MPSVRELQSKTQLPIGVEDRRRREEFRVDAERLQRSISVDFACTFPDLGVEVPGVIDRTWFWTSRPLSIEHLANVLVCATAGVYVEWELLFSGERDAATPTSVDGVITTGISDPNSAQILADLENRHIPARNFVWIEGLAHCLEGDEDVTGELHINQIPRSGGG